MTSSDHFNIDFPACPAVLVQIVKELRSEEPNLNQMAELVSRDIALSAAMLKLANSAAYGGQRNIATPREALSLIGLRKLRLLATSLGARNSFTAETPEKKAFLVKFWDKSDLVANACAQLSRAFKVDPDNAHLFGLFHDCGMVIMQNAVPGYSAHLSLIDSTWEHAELYENHKYGMSHAKLGARLAESWLLPADVCQAIRLHHDRGIFSDPAKIDPLVLELVFTGILGEYIAEVFLDLIAKEDFGHHHQFALEWLGISNDEFDLLMEDTLETLRELPSLS